MRQRFVDEFRIYEEKLFRNSEREHFHRHRSNDTLGNLYFRVTESICTTVVMCMTRFHNQELAAAASTNNRGGGGRGGRGGGKRRRVGRKSPYLLFMPYIR